MQLQTNKLNLIVLHFVHFKVHPWFPFHLVGDGWSRYFSLKEVCVFFVVENNLFYLYLP